MDWSDMSPSEQSRIGQLMEALFHVETLPELIRCLDEFISGVVVADCLGLCISKPGQPTQYDWLVAKMPTPFFTRAAEWAPEDFVRGAVARAPGTVLRDTDMIARKELESNAMYRISREVGTPFEHVLAVLLPGAKGTEDHGGFTAYRSSPRPFSERDQGLIQFVARLLAKTIQKCRQFMERDLNERLLESFAREQNVALLVLSPCAEVIKKTERIPELVEKWFPGECEPSGVPRVLSQKLAALTGGSQADPSTWEREGEGETLRVTFTPSGGDAAHWQLKFEERPHPLLVTWLKLLTEKEREIAYLLLQGKSDKEIAPLARCEPGTVKVHLRNIYRKTKVSGRTEFMARAQQKP